MAAGLNIAYKIALAGRTLQSGKTSRLLSLDTRANIGAPVNSCSLVLDAQAKVSVKQGDSIKVELGYDGTTTLVFTGVAGAIEYSIDQVKIEALSKFGAMNVARYNLLYEKQAAGDIVRDLLGRVAVKTAKLDNGETFPTFTVSDRYTISEVLNQLSARCGCDFYADAEDKAVFSKYVPGAPHAFRYGVNILDYRQVTLKSTTAGVEVYGESPAGQGQGEDASSWLTKKPVKGSAGKSSGSVLRVVDASARTPNLARALAVNLFGREAQARGTVRVIGAPEVKLGDAVQISKMPDEPLNGLFKVIGVHHRISAKSGFVTRIDWEKN